MKLVEILAKELKAWPSNTDSIYQDHDSELRFHGNRDTSLSNFYMSELCDDCLRKKYDSTPKNRVTKEMWEAEKAKQNSLSTVASDDELWGDVKEMYTKEKEVFNPIYCRDRIKEIDALVESLEEERVSLVQALEDEGFSLIERINKQLEECKQSHEDMSDPSNWEEGDLIECIDGGSGVYTKGSLYTFIEVSGWGSIRCIDDTGRENGVLPECFEWHSRPRQ